MADSGIKKMVDRLSGRTTPPFEPAPKRIPFRQPDLLADIEASNQLQWAHHVLVVNPNSKNPKVRPAGPSQIARAKKIFIDYMKLAERSDHTWHYLKDGRSGSGAWPLEIMERHSDLRAQALAVAPLAVARVDDGARRRHSVPPVDRPIPSPRDNKVLLEGFVIENLRWATGVLGGGDADTDLAAVDQAEAIEAASKTFADILLSAEHRDDISEAIKRYKWEGEVQRTLDRHPGLRARISADAPRTYEQIRQYVQPPAAQNIIEIRIPAPLGPRPTAFEEQVQFGEAATALHLYVATIGPARQASESGRHKQLTISAETRAELLPGFVELLAVTRDNGRFQQLLHDPNYFIGTSIVEIVTENPGLAAVLDQQLPGLLEQATASHDQRDTVPQLPRGPLGRSSRPAFHGIEPGFG